MSLNRTLDRLFDEIRREAKRNAEFAGRLDAVMRLHASNREVAEAVGEEVAREDGERALASSPPKVGKIAKPSPTGKPAPIEDEAVAAPALNPVGLYQREGEEALAKALENLGLPALQALVGEHNLDPSGAADELDRDGLVAHIIAHAKRRAEKDSKLFDY